MMALPTPQESAAEACTAPFRAPELFEVPSECTLDERVDVWVRATGHITTVQFTNTTVRYLDEYKLIRIRLHQSGRLKSWWF
jgi:serine/threonine protein kinase